MYSCRSGPKGRSMRNGEARSTGGVGSILAEANKRAAIAGRNSGGMTCDTL